MEARARAYDLSSSHAAADAIETSGKAQHHREILLAVVREHPGLTSAEITQYCELDRWQVARRLPELRNGKLVYNSDKKRECRMLGSLAFEWHPVVGEEQQLGLI